MVSTYHGIETGRRALEYFRKGMELAGTNTQNTLKEGYSRQTLKAEASPGFSSASSASYLGTGIHITEVARMRDMFLDAQMRRAETDQVYWKTMADGAKHVERLIVNTNDKGFSVMIDSFWSGLQGICKNPSDKSVRNAFLQESASLTNYVTSLSSSYKTFRSELNGDVKALVEDANVIIDRIAVISKSISASRAAGAEPNDLLDQRDLLADKLCKMTGAEVGTSADELDGDYKISLNGRLLVQGSRPRHLVLVKNPANDDYYDVQIQDNLYDVTSRPDVAQVIAERRADDMRNINGTCTMGGSHLLDVRRTADELYWTVGFGGDRIDDIKAKDRALNLQGSFSLQVGSKGVRAYSEAFTKNPPGAGNILGTPGPGDPQLYTFRLAAGSFESSIQVEWDSTNTRWNISDNLGSPVADAGPELSVAELRGFIHNNYNAAYNISSVQDASSPNSLVIESADRQIISITDINGDLMRSCGMINENPAVRIDVTADDSLQTIANKINNVYRFDQVNEIRGKEGGDSGKLSYETTPKGSVPSSPEQWMHASVEEDGRGGYFLCLTSNAAGEAHRINVMSGSVCGGGVNDMTIARRLGLVDDAGTHADVTSYIQLDRAEKKITTRSDPFGDVYVDDAWVLYDGKEYISDANAFKDARAVDQVGGAHVSRLEEFSPGIRVFLKGAGTTDILVRHPLIRGEIFAKLQLRDDVLLSQMDSFDDLTYKLTSQFNAIHRAGYGIEEYADTTGMSFFEQMSSPYGAFSRFEMDRDAMFNQNRFAAASGDGKGHSAGCGDGSGALTTAQLKQAKLFMSRTADFNDLYKGFVADIGAFGERAKGTLKTQDYVVEQIDIQRKSIMGVNSNEDMLSLVNMNSSFGKASHYISTLMQVMDKIIFGVGRVGL